MVPPAGTASVATARDSGGTPPFCRRPDLASTTATAADALRPPAFRSSAQRDHACYSGRVLPTGRRCCSPPWLQVDKYGGDLSRRVAATGSSAARRSTAGGGWWIPTATSTSTTPTHGVARNVHPNNQADFQQKFGTAWSGTRTGRGGLCGWLQDVGIHTASTGNPTLQKSGCADELQPRARTTSAFVCVDRCHVRRNGQGHAIRSLTLRFVTFCNHREQLHQEVPGLDPRSRPVPGRLHDRQRAAVGYFDAGQLPHGPATLQRRGRGVAAGAYTSPSPPTRPQAFLSYVADTSSESPTRRYVPTTPTT